MFNTNLIKEEGDLTNKPIFVTADNRLKYRAICCCINRSVLDNISGWCRLLNLIFGKSHQRRLPYQFPPLSSTRLGDNSLLSEKRWLFFVFSKEPIQSPLGQLGIVRQNFYLRSDLERSHPQRMASRSQSISCLSYPRRNFFVGFSVFVFVKVHLDGSQ